MQARGKVQASAVAVAISHFLAPSLLEWESLSQKEVALPLSPFGSQISFPTDLTLSLYSYR